MRAIPPKRRLPTRINADRALARWAFSAGLIATLGYIGLAAATLNDTIDGVPVSAIDAAWPFWLGTVLVALLAGGLAQFVYQRARPRPSRQATAESLPLLADQRRGNLAWVLPVVTTLASVLLVRLYHTPLAAYIGAAATLVVTTATIVAHYFLRDERTAVRNVASVSLAFLTHGCAFFLLTMIYSNKWRSMFSATGIALATLLMLLQLTDGEEIAWLRRLLYALVGGLLLGQLTWTLNYWAATGWTGGALLLVFFYFIAGVTAHIIRNNLTRRVLTEYVVVASVAFAIITASITVYR
jgi:hypothetical protein